MSEESKLSQDQLMFYLIGKLHSFEERQDRMEKLLIEIHSRGEVTRETVANAKESIGFFYWVYKFLKWPAAITATATLLTGVVSLAKGLWNHGL